MPNTFISSFARGQKSKTCLTGLRSRWQQGPVCFLRFRAESTPCLLQLLTASRPTPGHTHISVSQQYSIFRHLLTPPPLGFQFLPTPFPPKNPYMFSLGPPSKIQVTVPIPTSMARFHLPSPALGDELDSSLPTVLLT